MGKTTIGKLKEMLVLETEVNGEKAIVVTPKGCIIEVSSEDSYPSDVKDKDIDEAAEYLKKYSD